MSEITMPEILRANLAEVILRMLSLNLGDIAAFPFIDPPGPRTIRDGMDLLLELGAIEKSGKKEGDSGTEFTRLTDRGRRMSRLPIDPRIARMILEAEQEGCVEEVLVIASALSIQDPRERPMEQAQQADRMHAPFRDPTSDFITLLRIWNHYRERREALKTQNQMRKFCREHFLSYRRMREWRDVHDQIRMILDEQAGGKKPAKQIPRDAEALNAGIHKSILSGYLSSIAVKKEKNVYTATKGREVMIFPGSGLFKSGGNWIVAAEIVETSRLFARTVANIDPAWLEEVGGGLCRSTYAEPHWEKNRGEVVALEQVSLFGLVIVPGRPVSYGRIDPEESSRVFIRSALVEGNVKQNLPFLAHNRMLMERLSAMEDKVRRRDLLADEEQIARFYADRLPGVFDVRTLQKQIREQGGDRFLRMKEEDLLRDRPDEDALALYPDELASGRLRFRFSYRFTPGHPEDGVTMAIPVHLISKVPDGTADWSVPGLFREKVGALLRGLPKQYRKKLHPLAETMEIIQAELQPEEGSLLSALGKFIHDRFGVDIPATAWAADKLPDHLRMRYAIVDAGGKEVASGRDLQLFRDSASEADETAAFSRARKVWEKEGLTQWNFGDLPEEVALESRGAIQGFAYPGLEAVGGCVNIRLFPDRREAAEAHLKGVMALYALRFQPELKHLRKALALTGDMKVWAGALGGQKAFESRLFEKACRDLFAVPIRTEEEFRKHAEAAAERMLPRGRELLLEIKPFLKTCHETVVSMRFFEASNRFNRPGLHFLESLKRELDLLAPPDFLLKYDTERLGHVARYLKALTIRAERGLLHLEKVHARAREFVPYEDFLRDSLGGLTARTSGEKRQAIEAFRWLVEEYKVSLFAQELKTPYPVSKKRLDEKKREIERML